LFRGYLSLSDYVMNHPDREKGFPAFITWLEGNGMDTNVVSIEKYDVTGYGLKASKTIEVCICMLLLLLTAITS